LAKRVSVPFTSGSSLQLEEQIKEIEELMGFSSLYIGILAATIGYKCRWFSKALCFSSLYIGILAATLPGNSDFFLSPLRFSSLYIGILAAT